MELSGRSGYWNGIFYPPAARRPGGKRGAKPKFDELAYYAEHFDTVEVNTTFYGQPKAAVARTWADRTPEGFGFSLKLYRALTHADIYRASRGWTPTPSNSPDAASTRLQGRENRRVAGAVPAHFSGPQK